jgi:hypothetical protein
MRNTQIALGLVALMGISIGCGTSNPSWPSSIGRPIPDAASTDTAASQKPPFTVSPSVGLIGEEIRITGGGFARDVSVKLDGVAAQVLNVNTIGAIINFTTPAHQTGAVDVVVTNPGSVSSTLAGGFTYVAAEAFSVTASPSVVKPGGALTVKWTAPAGRTCIGGGDWVALYRSEDGDVTTSSNGHSDLWYDHLCGATSGSSALTAPTQPGQYDFRYMVGGREIAASRSNTITVEGK